MITTNKKTLVIGASPNPARYSFLAISGLREKKIPVEAIGKRPGTVADIKIIKEKKLFENIHTVTLYLNSKNQKEYYDYLLQLKPKRIIFNPGAENKELAKILKENNIEPLEACTLVMLSTGQY